MGVNSTDQPVRLGYWRQQKAAIQFYEKVLQKKEGLSQVLKWISSFALFLYGVKSVRNNVWYIQHTFNIFCNNRLPSGSLDKRRNWEIAVGSWWLLIVGLKMSCQSRSCALRTGTWRSSWGTLIGPVVVQRFIWSVSWCVLHAFGGWAERKALLCNQWCIYHFYFMKGYEFAYILIPAHRTDRYKRNNLEIRE